MDYSAFSRVSGYLDSVTPWVGARNCTCIQYDANGARVFMLANGLHNGLVDNSSTRIVFTTPGHYG